MNIFILLKKNTGKLQNKIEKNKEIWKKKWTTWNNYMQWNRNFLGKIIIYLAVGKADSILTHNYSGWRPQKKCYNHTISFKATMEKSAYHTVFIQKLKTILKVSRGILLFYFHFLIFFCSKKHDFDFSQKNVYHIIFIYQNVWYAFFHQQKHTNLR